MKPCVHTVIILKNNNEVAMCYCVCARAYEKYGMEYLKHTVLFVIKKKKKRRKKRLKYLYLSHSDFNIS